MLIARRKKGDKLKYFKNKKILIFSLITICSALMINAAINHKDKSVIKSLNISNNALLGVSEKALTNEKANDNPLIFNTTNEMISFYSKVFMLKENVITAKINELIKIDKDSFNKEYILNNIKYISKEEAILKTIADIYKNPGKYNLKQSEISAKTYELSNYKPEELIYKFSTILDVNPYIALSIAYCECGYKLNSYNFVKKHNIGGIKGKNGYVTYKNEAYGIYRFVLMLHNGYKVNSSSGTDKIRTMSKKYAGSSEHWINTVSSYYNTLNKKGFEYYYNKGKHNRSLNIPYVEV